MLRLLNIFLVISQQVLLCIMCVCMMYYMVRAYVSMYVVCMLYYFRYIVDSVCSRSMYV